MLRKIYAVIPARHAATRFHAKLLQTLGDKPVIAHTYLAAKNSGLFDEVMVATDSDEIAAVIQALGGLVFKSIAAHESGTDRIAEAVKDTDTDVIVNIQGDEPFIQTAPLQALVGLFNNKNVQAASLMRTIEAAEANNPNMVKVVVNKNNKALYFSRSAIPYNRDNAPQVPYHLHIGVYAFTKNALLNFTRWQQTPLEKVEKLEQLRFLENDTDIYMALTDYKTIAIDTPEDLIAAREYLHQIS